MARRFVLVARRVYVVHYGFGVNEIATRVVNDRISLAYAR